MLGVAEAFEPISFRSRASVFVILQIYWEHILLILPEANDSVKWVWKNHQPRFEFLQTHCMSQKYKTPTVIF